MIISNNSKGLPFHTHVTVLHEIALKAHAAVAAMSVSQQVGLLSRLSMPWDGRTSGTVWTGGVRDTFDGAPFSDSWWGLGQEMRSYSHNVCGKGEGAWFTPALSINGRCRDADICAITQLALDADAVGDWHSVRAVFTSAKLAFILQRSSSHRPDIPKWHLHVPLARWWSGEKAEWRQVYRHLVGAFSAVAQLNVTSGERPSYGFDSATDRKGQPWFFSTRRTVEDQIPETIVRLGGALDLVGFLRSTSFELMRQALPPRRKRAGRKSLPIPDEPLNCDFLLLRAFRNAGWLGRQLPSGAFPVACPWRDVHTSGSDFDSSTVVFPPSAPLSHGWFFCSHAHCRGRSQREVLLAIPPAALRTALRSTFEAVSK
jgi:hypothetical protein